MAEQAEVKKTESEKKPNFSNKIDYSSYSQREGAVLLKKTEQELLVDLVNEQKRTNKMLNLQYVLTWIGLIIGALYFLLRLIN